MAERNQAITPFQGGANSSDKSPAPKKVRVMSDVSRGKFSPGHDPLMQSLGTRMPLLPSKYHPFDQMTKVNPKGAHYNPAGEYGRIKGPTAKGTHYTPHTSRPGQNANGNNGNRVGQKSGYPNFTPRGGGGGRGV